MLSFFTFIHSFHSASENFFPLVKSVHRNACFSLLLQSWKPLPCTSGQNSPKLLISVLHTTKSFQHFKDIDTTIVSNPECFVFLLLTYLRTGSIWKPSIQPYKSKARIHLKDEAGTVELLKHTTEPGLLEERCHIIFHNATTATHTKGYRTDPGERECSEWKGTACWLPNPSVCSLHCHRSLAQWPTECVLQVLPEIW